MAPLQRILSSRISVLRQSVAGGQQILAVWDVRQLPRSWSCCSGLLQLVLRLEDICTLAFFLEKELRI
jgi:hypothetical protein